MWIVKDRVELFRLALYLTIVGGLVLVVVKGLGPWIEANPVSGDEAPEVASHTMLLDPGAVLGADFFAAYRVDRDRARSELKETLREVMASGAAEDETRQEANRRYLSLGHAAEVERRAESLLKAKGFADAIVELADGTVQVIIKAPQLDKAQAAQVIDIVARLSGVQPQQINIITRGF